MGSQISSDVDRALDDENRDEYGFSGIAKKITPSLIQTVHDGGVVVGIEGPWGSGKTTLLNFIVKELNENRNKDLHILKIAPWLIGDNSSLVSGLFEPIAEIIENKEEEIAAKNSAWWALGRKRVEKKFSKLIRSYGVKTSRAVAPLSKLAEYVIPGASIAGDAASLASNYLNEFARYPTSAEMKDRISKKLSDLGVYFIIILDDLDRLEPAQAVEVIRLVKSVADFPNITYIMCYDREILSQALEKGLCINDGYTFLQKIVQVSFSIPLYEPFDLRISFLNQAIEVYRQVNGKDLQPEEMEDLRGAVDRQGSKLSTPREVKLALNGIKFIYPSIYEDVYFPDVCRLFLIKTTKRNLYKWIEEYLGVRSVVVSNDASVGADDRIRLGEELGKLLPSEDYVAGDSISDLSTFVPGIKRSELPKDRVFALTSPRELRRMIKLRRLGSPINYRYYFALTSPKTVMDESEMERLYDLAKRDPNSLRKELTSLAQRRRSSGQTWFAHFLDRLDSDAVHDLEKEIVYGILISLVDAMDDILKFDNSPHFLMLTSDQAARIVVEDIFRKLRDSDKELFDRALRYLSSSDISVNWKIGTFLRAQMWSNGFVGDREKVPEERTFSDEELRNCIEFFDEIVARSNVKDSIIDMPDMASYLFGWRDLSGINVVREWVADFVKNDSNFLKFLLRLRGWAMSDKVFYPLNRDTVEVFLVWEETCSRVDELLESDLGKIAQQVKDSIKLGRDFRK